MNRSLLILLALVSCGKPKPQAESTQTEPSARPVADSKRNRCGVDSNALLTDQGIGQFIVGATVDDVRAHCTVVKDTSMEFGGEGLPERRLSVLIGRDTVDATVDSSQIWRIEIASRSFHTVDGIGVGTTIRQLRSRPLKYLGYGEGGPFLMLKNHCGLSLEVSEFPGIAKTFADVPDSAVVARILVVGCRA